MLSTTIARHTPRLAGSATLEVSRMPYEAGARNEVKKKMVMFCNKMMMCNLDSKETAEGEGGGAAPNERDLRRNQCRKSGDGVTVLLGVAGRVRRPAPFNLIRTKNKMRSP